MWLVAFSVLLTVAGERVYPDPLRPTEIACLGEKTVVGRSEDSHFIWYDGTRWQKSALAESVADIWQAPNGRIYASSASFVAEIREPLQIAATWHLRDSGPLRVLLLKGELFAASSAKLHRLDPSGTVGFEGVTPVSPLAVRPFEPPVLLDSDLGTIICTGSRATESERIRGHCLGPYRSRYSYPAEFGGFILWPDEHRGTEPFICSDVVISARKNGTQARQASDGIQVGRTQAVHALPGSQCLPDGRVFLVGKREVGVFELPGLRRIWRQPLKGNISDVALCGGKIAVLSSPRATLTMIDIPPGIVGK